MAGSFSLERQSVREHPDDFGAAARRVLPTMRAVAFEVDGVARGQRPALVADVEEDRALDHAADLVAGMGHRLVPGMRAGFHDAVARLEYAGAEMAVQIVQRQAHFLVFEPLAPGGIDDGGAL